MDAKNSALNPMATPFAPGTSSGSPKDSSDTVTYAQVVTNASLSPKEPENSHSQIAHEPSSPQGPQEPSSSPGHVHIEGSNPLQSPMGPGASGYVDPAINTFTGETPSPNSSGHVPDSKKSILDHHFSPLNNTDQNPNFEIDPVTGEMKLKLISDSGPVPVATVNSSGGDTSPEQPDATKGSYLDRKDKRPAPYTKTKPGSHKGAHSPTPEKPFEGGSSPLFTDDQGGDPFSENGPTNDGDVDLDEDLLNTSPPSEDHNTSVPEDTEEVVSENIDDYAKMKQFYSGNSATTSSSQASTITPHTPLVNLGILTQAGNNTYADLPDSDLQVPTSSDGKAGGEKDDGNKEEVEIVIGIEEGEKLDYEPFDSSDTENKEQQTPQPKATEKPVSTSTPVKLDVSKGAIDKKPPGETSGYKIPKVPRNKILAPEPDPKPAEKAAQSANGVVKGAWHARSSAAFCRGRNDPPPQCV